MTPVRRKFLKNVIGVCSTPFLSSLSQAQSLSQPTIGLNISDRTFTPSPGRWRTFEVTTRVEIDIPSSPTRVWLPVPCVESPWQTSLENQFQSNGSTVLTTDGNQGVKMLLTEFPAGQPYPFVEITSTVKTQSRMDLVEQGKKPIVQESTDTLKYFTRSTKLLPTDGIVRSTALKITQNLRYDEEKVRAIYEWIVANAWREPKVRGCGEGDIKLMLETGNLGGKCADINALFVGLCRSINIPARDLYGIRLVPSAYGYKELSGNPDSLKGAQHCRAEVYLANKGWVAMDPADVAKVMRQETPEWIKAPLNPIVKPVYQTLFGGWEGNWLAWNSGHDIKLPTSRGSTIGFLMYPIAENNEGRFDSYSPDTFKYQIKAKELL
jgi:transglutaminase-like putative cysteine protease